MAGPIGHTAGEKGGTKGGAKWRTMAYYGIMARQQPYTPNQDDGARIHVRIPTWKM